MTTEHKPRIHKITFIETEKPKAIGIAYRYADTLHGSEYGDTYVAIYCHEYSILKRTVKGIWIDIWGGQKKFINLEARKKFACLTREEALESFIARKKRQIRILTSQLLHAKEALAKAEVINQ